MVPCWLGSWLNCTLWLVLGQWNQLVFQLIQLDITGVHCILGKRIYFWKNHGKIMEFDSGIRLETLDDDIQWGELFLLRVRWVPGSCLSHPWIAVSTGPTITSHSWVCQTTSWDPMGEAKSANLRWYWLNMRFAHSITVSAPWSCSRGFCIGYAMHI